MGFGATELIILAVVTALVAIVIRWLTRRAGSGMHVSGPPDDDGTESRRSIDRAVDSPATGARQTRAQADGPTKVFIAYRREDSADITGRIYDKLIQHLGRDQVFKDVDSVPFGVDFRKHLDQVVGRCEIMLVIIGDRWLTSQDGKGARRLDDQNDFVRVEVESALRRDIPVVPVLVRGAQMPSEVDLPDSMKPLAYRNGIAVRVDPDFHTDMDRLLSGLHLRP